MQKADIWVKCLLYTAVVVYGVFHLAAFLGPIWSEVSVGTSIIAAEKRATAINRGRTARTKNDGPHQTEPSRGKEIPWSLDFFFAVENVVIRPAPLKNGASAIFFPILSLTYFGKQRATQNKNENKTHNNKVSQHQKQWKAENYELSLRTLRKGIEKTRINPSFIFASCASEICKMHTTQLSHRNNIRGMQKWSQNKI